MSGRKGIDRPAPPDDPTAADRGVADAGGSDASAVVAKTQRSRGSFLKMARLAP